MVNQVNSQLMAQYSETYLLHFPPSVSNDLIRVIIPIHIIRDILCSLLYHVARIFRAPGLCLLHIKTIVFDTFFPLT